MSTASTTGASTAPDDRASNTLAHSAVLQRLRLTARIRVVLGGILAVLIAVIATTAPAHAGATGASGWGRVTYNGYGAPQGVYYAEINGSGTYVNYVKGWPYMTTPVSGNICNWNITAEFFDVYGRWYRTVNGPTHYTCNSYYRQAGASVLGIYSRVQPGKMCSTLKSNGGRVTSVCHSIY